MPLTQFLRVETRHMSPCLREYFGHSQTRLTRHCRSASSLSSNRSSLAILTSSRNTLPRLLSAAASRRSLPMTATQTMTQSRSHAGHSHGHGHSHDTAYLTSKNKNDAGVRITRIGLFVNLAMAISKGIGGYVFHSQALIADGFHALTDLVSDFMTLATISWSLRPATSRFPSGYGKIESLGALGVSGLLLFGGVGIGFNALDVLYSQLFLDAAAQAHEHAEHSHGLFSFLGHSHGPVVPDLNAAWLAGGSIIVKEWLYRASKLSPLSCSMRILRSDSYEDCSGTQIGCPSLERRSSSSRLPH